MGCKDCTENKDSYKYYWLEDPDKIIFKRDYQAHIEYYIPAGNVFGMLSKDYFSSSEYDTFKTEYCTFTGITIEDFYLLATNRPYRKSISSALKYVAEITDTRIGFVVVSLPNPNYTKYDDSTLHSKVYSWDDFYENIYEELQCPVWLLSFNKCGLKSPKDISYNGLKIEGCGINTVEFRLKFRSLFFIDHPTKPFHNNPFGIFPGHIEQGIYSIDAAIRQYEFFKGTENKSGSKILGLAPLRYEVGIYYHNDKTYDPIISSSYNYPQSIWHDSNRVWLKERPDILSSGNLSLLLDPINGSPNITTINSQNNRVLVKKSMFAYVTKSKFSFGFLYAGVLSGGAVSITDYSVGVVEESSANIYTTTPSRRHLVFSKKLLSDLFDPNVNFDIDAVENRFNNYTNALHGIAVSTPSSQDILDLRIEVLLNDCDDIEYWFTLTDIRYYIKQYTNQPSYIEFELFEEAINVIQYTPTFCNGNVITDITTQTSNTIFYTLNDNYKYRYVFNISESNINAGTYVSTFKVPYDTNVFDERDYGNPVIVPNYSTLTNDFTSELNGFAHVDLDKGPVSLYLKLKPENTGYDDIVYTKYRRSDIQLGNIAISSTSNYFYTHNTNNSTIYNIDNVWGELGVDERTNFIKPNVVYYEPVLPIRPEYIPTYSSNLLQSSKLTADRHLRKNIAYKSDDFKIIMDEGWVRVKKLEEECCDDKVTNTDKLKKTFSSKQIIYS